MKQDIIWERPPTKTKTVDYAWFYELLEANPMEWARYPGTQSAASQWCKDHPKYEYRSSMTDDGRKVWMRYVG